VTSAICVDASFIIRTLTPNPDLEHATDLLEEWIENQQPLIAPSLLSYEVSSVLRRLQYLNRLESTIAQEAFLTFHQLGITLIDSPQLHNLAWRLAQQFGHSRTYDSAYLAAAQLHNAEMWTADKKLYNSVAGQLTWVQILSE
jgi:predicted nucleic acid-binding protein